ncbi:MAG: cytochrome c [Flavobacteriales bacterium]
MRVATVCALFALLAGCGEAPDAAKAVTVDGKPDGEAIYTMYCELCHGADGTLALNGAKDLAQSTLGKDEMTGVVTHGRKTMSAYGQVLNAAQIEAVVDHVAGLRSRP